MWLLDFLNLSKKDKSKSLFYDSAKDGVLYFRYIEKINLERDYNLSFKDIVFFVWLQIAEKTISNWSFEIQELYDVIHDRDYSLEGYLRWIIYVSKIRENVISPILIQDTRYDNKIMDSICIDVTDALKIKSWIYKEINDSIIDKYLLLISEYQ